MQIFWIFKIYFYISNSNFFFHQLCTLYQKRYSKQASFFYHLFTFVLFFCFFYETSGVHDLDNILIDDLTASITYKIRAVLGIVDKYISWTMYRGESRERRVIIKRKTLNIHWKTMLERIISNTISTRGPWVTAKLWLYVRVHCL